jgi:hypothetical protein
MAHVNQWEDIENYIQAAIAAATGYAIDQVIWKHQNYNAPETDYAVIELGDVIALGQDFVRYSTNLSRPAGQEIKQSILGTREVPLEIEVFSSSVIGNTSARSVLEKARTALRLPTIKYGLRKGGIAPFDLGTVNFIPHISNTGFRGRAVCSIRCYVVMPEVVEYCGYISRVRGTYRYWVGASGYSGGVSGYTGTAAIFDTNNA